MNPRSRPNGLRPLTDLERDFRAFHERNPQVYDELVRLAREAKRAGAKKLSTRMLWEVMRWNQRSYLTTDDPGSEYRLNDHYTPYYARLIMDSEPDLAGFFEVRSLKSERQTPTFTREES